MTSQSPAVLMWLLLCITAVQPMGAARTKTPKPNGDTKASPPRMGDADITLSASWRDVVSDLPAWKVHLCVTHGGGGIDRLEIGSLGVPIDDPDFDNNCVAMYAKAAQHCIDEQEAEWAVNHRLPPGFPDISNLSSEAGGNRTAQAHTTKQEVQKMHRSRPLCKKFKAMEDDSKKTSGIGNTIEQAVRLCEVELPDVCVNWCTIQALIENQPPGHCFSTCSNMRNGCAHGQWHNCVESGLATNYATDFVKLKAGSRNAALEAIMHEATRKCVCMGRPPTGVYEGHEHCYKTTPGVGPMLDRGQKWCEWSDPPSWKPLKAAWARQFPGKPMPTPTCTEFPFFKG